MPHLAAPNSEAARAVTRHCNAFYAYMAQVKFVNTAWRDELDFLPDKFKDLEFPFFCMR
jgi:hypothetical protein